MARIAPTLLLLISLSIALSYVSAYRPLTTAPAPVSYISSTPEASPTLAPAPAPGPSSDNSEFLGFSSKMEEMDYFLLLDNLDSAIGETNLFLSEIINRQLYNPTTNESTKVCLDVCQQMYGNALQALKKGVKDVEKRDYFEFNVDCEAFVINVHNCLECFEEKAPVEFNWFDNHAKELSSRWLTYTQEYVDVPSFVHHKITN